MCNLFVLCPVLQQGDYELNLIDIFSLKGPWRDMSGNRPFLHCCKKRHQVKARMETIQWFVWKCPSEPCPCFFMFAHWSVMWERSLQGLNQSIPSFWLDIYSSLTSCYFKSCLSCEITNNSWLLPLLCILLVISILGHCVALWNNIIILIHK